MRAGEKHGKLRGCPTCGTKVSEVELGLRDFSWVNEALPGRIGLMDIDGCLTQVRGDGRGLMLELKPKGELVTTGARLTFAYFVKLGLDVWVLWDQGNGRVKVAELNEQGRPRSRPREMEIRRAANLVKAWWEEGAG